MKSKKFLKLLNGSRKLLLLFLIYFEIKTFLKSKKKNLNIKNFKKEKKSKKPNIPNLEYVEYYPKLLLINQKENIKCRKKIDKNNNFSKSITWNFLNFFNLLKNLEKKNFYDIQKDFYIISFFLDFQCKQKNSRKKFLLISNCANNLNLFFMFKQKKKKSFFFRKNKHLRFDKNLEILKILYSFFFSNLQKKIKNFKNQTKQKKFSINDINWKFSIIYLYSYLKNKNFFFLWGKKKNLNFIELYIEYFFFLVFFENRFLSEEFQKKIKIYEKHNVVTYSDIFCNKKDHGNKIYSVLKFKFFLFSETSQKKNAENFFKKFSEKIKKCFSKYLEKNMIKKKIHTITLFILRIKYYHLIVNTTLHLFIFLTFFFNTFPFKNKKNSSRFFKNRLSYFSFFFSILSDFYLNFKKNKIFSIKKYQLVIWIVFDYYFSNLFHELSKLFDQTIFCFNLLFFGKFFQIFFLKLNFNFFELLKDKFAVSYYFAKCKISKNFLKKKKYKPSDLKLFFISFRKLEEFEKKNKLKLIIFHNQKFFILQNGKYFLSFYFKIKLLREGMSIMLLQFFNFFLRCNFVFLPTILFWHIQLNLVLGEIRKVRSFLTDSILFNIIGNFSYGNFYAKFFYFFELVYGTKISFQKFIKIKRFLFFLTKRFFFVESFF